MLIVAVHDVAPSTLPEVRWLLGRLDAAGVTRRVLKVIPSEPGASADGISELAELARAEAAAGSEIVLHGWTHRAGGQYRGALLDRARGRIFAGGAAEFLALTPAAMSERLAAGTAWLLAERLAAIGFCPPAWLSAPGLATVARVHGFRYLLTFRGLLDLDRNRWHTLPPIGYLGAGPIQEAMLRAGGVLIFGPLRSLLKRPIRVYLHPQRASRSRDCARVLREIQSLARHHAPATYAELLHA